MREKSKTIQYKLKTVVYFVVSLLALVTVTPVLAEYLGPDRTVTETNNSCKVVLYKCSYVASKNIYKYKSSSNWSCSNESKPWLAYPSSGPACTASTVGATYWGKVNTQQQQNVTYPPATINGLLQNCTLNNGWCISAPQLFLSGDEPVDGYEIMAIEGTLNGQNFACPDSDCSVPLSEGDNDLTYWAVSSWGDTSTMSSLSAKVDSQKPVISGEFTGATGSNGWYLGPVSFTGSATDATSGLSSFTCTLDGATLGSCNSISVTGEGVHTLVLTALDNAGNSNLVTQGVSIDSLAPTLSSSLQGTLGSNSWYNDAKLLASASDPVPGSGLSGLEYNVDDTSWTTFPSSGVLDLPEGKHSVDIRASDNAGHSVSASKAFWLDSIAPNVLVNPQGTLGKNNWYVTSLKLAASVSDDTSGLDVFEYSFNGSAWATYTAPLTLTDGSHNVSFWAQDKGGLTTQVDRAYQVDTVPPQISGSVSGTPGTNNWYISDVVLSASAADPLPGSGIEAFTYILDSGSQMPYTSDITISDGLHTIQLDAQDKAGLTYSTEPAVKVDTIRPSITIETTLPDWVKDKVVIAGSSGDAGSGLSKVEISTDGGQSWQTTSGIDTWSYEWDTTSGSNGAHTVIARAVDQAGLTTEQTLPAAVDNQTPTIVVPISWLQWQTVTLDIWDNDSGLSEARVVISDPNGRWPKRVIQLDSAQFPLDFKWDRRFGDNTIAPNGTYDVTVTAIDQLGNATQQTASVKVIIDILPAGPAATPQPYYRMVPTPLGVLSPIPTSSPAATPTTVVSVFGETQPTAQVTSTPQTSPVPHATPTQTGVLEWLESILIPRADSIDQITELDSTPIQSAGAASPGTDSNILWGAAAAAMVGAATSYALEEKRKKEQERAEARAAEAALEERKAKIHAQKMQKLEAQWAQEKAWEQARLQTQAAKTAADNRIKAKLTEREIKDEISWVTLQNALQKQAQEKQHVDKLTRMEEQHVRLDTYVERPREPVVAESTVPESSWWEKTKSFVEEKIFEPYLRPAVAALDETVFQPYVKPLVEKATETKAFQTLQNAFTPKNVLTSVIALTLGANTVQWINNVKSNPDVFSPVHEYADSLAAQLTTKYPHNPENSTFSYLFSHPYEVATIGTDYFSAITSIGASYADALWQQNPVVEMQIESLESLESSLCSQTSSPAWENRCTAGIYLAAGVTATPFDTALGVINGLAVDPVAGLIKQGTLIVENYEAIPEVIRTIADEGWQAGKDLAVDQIKNYFSTIVEDKQVQSAWFVAGLLALALVAAPVAAGIGLGMAVNTLIDLDSTVVASNDKSSLINFITSHEARTAAVSSLLIMALITAGLGNKVSEFRAFQEQLSPSAQTAFNGLDLLEQTRIAELALTNDISPGALEFYLTESARTDSPLANLSLVDALRVSSLAEQTGKTAFLLDYVNRYGTDPAAMKALLNSEPAVEPWSSHIPETRYDDVSAAFREEPLAITLQHDITVYRYWSGSVSREVGSWLTFDPNMTPAEARALLALPDSNMATNVTQFTIPKGTTILIGEATEQTTASWAGTYAVGEGIQIYVSDPTMLIKTPE